MDQEVSVVARKLERFFEPETKPQAQSARVTLLQHIACVALLGVAVLLTKASLALTRLVKKIEN